MKKSIKALAMYLPQFHQVKDNDEWWGSGYTEWTAVKNGEPLYNGHVQPKKPLEGKYYNLLDKETLRWQSELAKKYGIAGFCFYHYWFGKDRKILEKPAEILLDNKDIDMPFCFCWDSSQWARTWSKMGNAWADAFEPKRDKNDTSNGVLIEQKYGNEAFWRRHFDYLLEFFKDNRYIKVDGKPVFMFYTSYKIPCFERMVFYWRRWAKEEGFPDLYIIGFFSPSLCLDAVVTPMAFNLSALGYNPSLEFLIQDTSVRGYNYDEVWEDYLNYIPSSINKTLWLCTVDFDDTPRRGKNGRVYIGASPEKFKKYFSRLVSKSVADDNPFVFIDAWNEWGEGKYLEPDVVHGYGYLKSVRDVMSKTGSNEKAGTAYNENMLLRYLGKLEKQLLRASIHQDCLTEWMYLKMEGKSIADYLCKCGFEKIAIYGCGIYGKMLYNELKDSVIDIAYFIDIHKDGLKHTEVADVYSPDESLPLCDVIIVSIIGEYVDIFKVLKQKNNIPIISLYEVVYEAKES